MSGQKLRPIGKFLGCRKKEVLKLWDAPTREKMVVEMPMKWHDINDINDMNYSNETWREWKEWTTWKERENTWTYAIMSYERMDEWKNVIDEPGNQGPNDTMSQQNNQPMNEWISDMKWCGLKLNDMQSMGQNETKRNEMTWKNEWPNEGMNGGRNEWRKEWVNESTHEWLNEWVNQRLEEPQRNNNSLIRWVNEAMNQWIKEPVNPESMHQWANEAKNEGWVDEWMHGRATFLHGDLFAAPVLSAASFLNSRVAAASQLALLELLQPNSSLCTAAAVHLAACSCNPEWHQSSTRVELQS